MEHKLERLSFHDLLLIMHQYGILHGLLAGFTALIRGAYESEGLGKALLDAALCAVIGTFVFSLPLLEEYLADHPSGALIICIVIGIVGANLIITTIRSSFSAAISQLNPTKWFKKSK